MKKIAAIALAAGLCAASARAQSAEGMFAQGQVAAVLDAFHAAAAAADEDKYFSYLAPDAVFLGTDATERWTKDEFRKWAHPYFAKGKAWTYRSTARWVAFSPDRRFALGLSLPNGEERVGASTVLPPGSRARLSPASPASRPRARRCDGVRR